MGYVTICLGFALAGGIVGRVKGSSFALWFLISGLVPILGLLAAVLYRFESNEPRRRCPHCGRVTKIYDALCVRCGTEFDWVGGDPDQVIAPESWKSLAPPH
jgi:hypothetical protein